MNIEKLKENIVLGNGKWEPKEGFIFTQEEGDGTVWVKCERENEKGSGFLMPHSKGDLKDFYIQTGLSIKEINKNIRFVQMLNNILEIGIQIESVTEKEVKVEVEKIVIDEKSKGVIEAYEKLLIGRKVTLEN